MKKFMALALAIAMIMAIVPTSFAASLNRATIEKETATSVGQVNKDLGNFDGINKKYMSMPSLNTAEKGWADLGLNGFPEIDAEEADTRGYWVDGLAADSALEEVNDFYTNGAPVYAMKFTPSEGNSAKTYSKGETVWMNLDLIKDFADGALDSLPEYEDGYKMTLLTYAADIDADTMPLVDRSINLAETDTGISVKFTAPEDNYAFLFILVIDKVAPLSDGFGIWLTLSSLDKDAEFKKAPKGADAEVGKPVTTEVGGKDSKLVVAPAGSTYGMTYVQAHKINLEGGQPYVVSFDSTDGIGVHVWICDENMDVIGENYLPGFALDYGYTYGDAAFALWPTETASYYVVVGGYWMTDEGKIDVTVTPWNEYVGAYELTLMDEKINLDELGSTDINADVENPDWFYHYYSDDKIGVLVLGTPGTYTLKGDGSDVMVYAFDGIKIVYDGAKTSNIRLMNSFSPVSVEAKGTGNKISGNEFFGYGIFNDDDATAGLYIVGDELTVDGIFGIVMENAPVHLAAKKLVVDTTSMQDYYPIAIWVLGMNGQELTFGKNAKLDGKLQLTHMFYDEACYFHYGYTISESAELARASESLGLENATLYFELTTDGLGGGNSTGDLMLGDANLDGNVNTGDATMILKHAASMLTLEGQGYANADVNQDGNVNTGDATMVLKIAANIIPNPNN